MMDRRDFISGVLVTLAPRDVARLMPPQGVVAQAPTLPGFVRQWVIANTVGATFDGDRDKTKTLMLAILRVPRAVPVAAGQTTSIVSQPARLADRASRALERNDPALRRMLVTTPAARAVPSEIRSISQASQTTAPFTKDDMYSAYGIACGNPADELSRKAERYAHYIALGVQTAGAVSSYFYPPAGIALSIAGIFTEDALLALLPAPDHELNSCRTVMLTESMSSALTDPRLIPGLQSASDLAGAMINWSDPDVVRIPNLPSDQFAAVGQPLLLGVPGSDGDLTKQGQTKQALESGINVALADLRARSSRLEEAAAKAAQDAQYQKDVMQRAVEAEKAYGELRGAATIGSFILGDVFGAKDAARLFGGASNAAIDIYRLTDLFSAGKIGTFAFSGGVLSAALTFTSLFGESPNQQVLNALQHVSDQIGNFQKQINERLDRIEARQIVDLQIVSAILQTVTQNAVDTHQKLQLISNKLDSFRQTYATDARQAALDAFLKSMDNLRDILVTSSTSANSTPGLFLEDLYHHAIRTSTEGPFAGDPVVPLTLGEFRRQITLRGRVDLVFGLFDAFASLVHANLSGSSFDLPNPVEYARGTHAFMEALVLNKDRYPVANLPSKLQDLWLRGSRIRTVVNAVLAPSVITGLATTVQSTLGATKPVAPSASPRPAMTFTGGTTFARLYAKIKALEATFPPSNPRKVNSPTPSPQGPAWASSAGYQNAPWYAVDFDPVYGAAAANLIEIRPVAGPLPVRGQWFKLYTKYGEFPGQPIINDSYYLYVYGVATWMSFPTALDPLPLFTYMDAFVRQYVLDQLGTNVAQMMIDAISEIDVPGKLSFDDTASAFQALAVLAKWSNDSRGSPRTPQLAIGGKSFALGADIDYQPYLSQVPSTMGKDSLVFNVRDIVSNHVKPADISYADVTLAALNERVMDDIARLSDISATGYALKGFEIVDCAMRKLAAYMKLIGVAIPS
jgi:hypothetical protein